MAVPTSQIAQSPRALAAIAQWATRDGKPDAKQRRTDAIVAMWRAGVISPEEFEGYSSLTPSKQQKRWSEGFYAKKFPTPDAASLALYVNWYKLLYPPLMQIAVPSLGSTIGKLGFVPEAHEPAPEGDPPPLDPPSTVSRGMGPFLLAAGGLLALVKVLGK